MTSNMAEKSKQMSEVSMLTILIQASAFLKNRNGDPSLQGYLEMQELQAQDLHRTFSPAQESHFTFLDSLANILVQDTQVVAASYNSVEQFTIVVPNLESDQEPEAVDMEFPPAEAVRCTDKLMPLHAAVIPNPNDRAKGGHSAQSGPLGGIREIVKGKSLWNISDPLLNIEK